MNGENKPTQYLLIFRGNDWHKGLSLEQMQQVANQWMAWFKRLSDEGIAVAGNPLEPQGRIVSGKQGRVTDGPFAESKEAVGGYFLLNVDTLERATEIARQCPGLPYGAVVEVRPVAERCPLSCQDKAEAALEAATA